MKSAPTEFIQTAISGGVSEHPANCRMLRGGTQHCYHRLGLGKEGRTSAHQILEEVHGADGTHAWNRLLREFVDEYSFVLLAWRYGDATTVGSSPGATCGSITDALRFCIRLDISDRNGHC